MISMHGCWLELAVLLPWIGAAIVSQMTPERARQSSIGITAGTFFCTLAAWLDYGLRGAVRFDFSALGGGSPLEVDPLSAPLLPLAALLYLLTTLSTLGSKVRRFSFAWSLCSLAISLATLCSKEPWIVIALLGLAAVPRAVELHRRGQSMRVFVLHMGLFIVLMVLGWSVVESEGRQQTHTLWAIIPLMIAVMIRCGMAPFHCWMTDLFERATFGTSLLFVAPMLGAYAAVRLVFPIAPDWALRGLGWWSLFNAVYAGGMALVQREARRLFCFIFISNASLVLLGLESGDEIGLTGALVVWLSMGLSMAGFGLTVRALEARHGRLSLVGFRGLYEHTPLLAICLLLTGLASVGFPGTFGFLGMEMLVDASVQTWPYAGVATVIAAALNGIAILQTYFRLFTGTRFTSTIPLQVGWREKLAMLSLALLILGGGLFPRPGVNSRHRAAESLLRERERLHLHNPDEATDHAATEAASRAPVSADLSATTADDDMLTVEVNPSE